MDECRVCKGKLEERLITRFQEYNGGWYIIENLPALICTQCGETYFTPQAHDRMIDLITGGAEPVRLETVLVMDASAEAHQHAADADQAKRDRVTRRYTERTGQPLPPDDGV